MLKPKRHCTGFTLIELMVVLVIAGLILTIAIPSFQQLIRRQQITTTTNALFYAIQLTRAEAIRRNHIVQLAPLDDADWVQGWRIYVSGTGTERYRDGDHVILRHNPLPVDLRIEGHAGNPAEIVIAYNGGGHSIRRNRSTLASSWQLHLKEEVRMIAINFQGRVRICNPITNHRNCKLN